MGHIIPQVAQEVEKGFVMGMRLESTPSGYPIVDKPWVDGLSRCEMHFEGDPELLAVCEPAENSREGVEGRMDEGGSIFGGQIHKGKWMGLNEESKGRYVDWTDTRMATVEHNIYVKKTGVSNSRFEGGNCMVLSKRNLTNLPCYPHLIHRIPIPPCRLICQPVPVSKDPDPKSVDTLPEPEFYPNAVRWPADRATIFNDAKGHETTQDVELATPSAPENAAAGVDEDKNAVLEGEKALDCANAADFVDEGAGATVIDSEMFFTNLKPWADAINDVLAAWRANGPMEIFYEPEGASFFLNSKSSRKGRRRGRCRGRNRALCSAVDGPGCPSPGFGCYRTWRATIGVNSSWRKC